MGSNCPLNGRFGSSGSLGAINTRAAAPMD